MEGNKEEDRSCQWERISSVFWKAAESIRSFERKQIEHGMTITFFEEKELQVQTSYISNYITPLNYTRIITR